MLLQWPFTSQETITLATPNYGYEKRQRELAKKKKKEDKLRAKAERKPGDAQDQPPVEGPEGAAAESGDGSGGDGD